MAFYPIMSGPGFSDSAGRAERSTSEKSWGRWRRVKEPNSGLGLFLVRASSPPVRVPKERLPTDGCGWGLNMPSSLISSAADRFRRRRMSPSRPLRGTGTGTGSGESLPSLAAPRPRSLGRRHRARRERARCGARERRPRPTRRLRP